MKITEFFLVTGILVLGAIVFDANVPADYMAITSAGKRGDAVAVSGVEGRDLTEILMLHRQSPNGQWKPNKSWDEGERQQVHLVVLDRKDLDRICGEDARACTISDASPELAASVNANLPSTSWVFEHACIIFVEPRTPDTARTWFYLLGHEFAHCRYFDFHDNEG